MKILVAEAIEVYCRICRKVLGDYLDDEKSVVITPSGEDALSYLKSDPLDYSLLIAGDDLTGLSNLELIAACSKEEKLKGLKKIVVSKDSSSIHFMKKAFSEGALLVLYKPFTESELLSVVKAMAPLPLSR